MKTTYTLLVTGLAAQQAAATWDMFASPFLKTPMYNNNECSEKQKGGFDWSELNDGDSNFKYGDFDFSGGWKCSSSLGKRDSLTRRTFGSKMIKNTVTHDKPASFSCDQRSSGFSITDIDVSVEFDTELEMHYKMDDGKTCKQYATCAQGGTTLTNTQCGGAKYVDVYLSHHYKGEKSSCEIGFHHIGFDCDKGTSYVPPKGPEAPPATSSKAPPPSSAPPAESSTPPSYPTGGACQGKDCTSESTHEASTSSAIETPSSVISFSTAPPFTNSSTSAYTAPPYVETSQAPPPSVATSTATPLAKTSSVVSAPPSTETYPAAPPAGKSSTVSPVPGSSVVASSSAVASTGCGYGGSCEGTTVVPVPFTSSAAPQPSSPSYPPVSPPDVLPKCMNTWLQVDSKCKNNADKACYCTNPEFTKKVIDCVTAWCGTDEETQKSLQYLIGICAEHVPENPKIIEDCPSYIPLNPAPAPPTGGATGGVSMTVPAGETPAPQSPAPAAPVTTITYGNTSITVPLVHFTTETNVAGAVPTEPVGLVPGTAPAQTPAATTGSNGAPYPIPSTMGTKTAPLATGTGAVRPSSPAQFTGAAAPFKVVPVHAFIGAALAFFAL
ncbi:hypothetical protein T440DRAFT_467071 [Plenodomus tracheiphilus IPT5]|uniref:CFEM domain-containing protein n=1 Tax=Plenodomus tracheiphilus IPT5 TaxID=1408161 RepID=A0A6A7BA30_9PLEO|nr:hypothetical protein T440DRAFT_467071 [Plenodomus tracheiphilus IPT5]